MTTMAIGKRLPAESPWSPPDNYSGTGVEFVDYVWALAAGAIDVLDQHRAAAKARERSRVPLLLEMGAKADIEAATEAWKKAYSKGDAEALEAAALDRHAAVQRAAALHWRAPGAMLAKDPAVQALQEGVKERSTIVGTFARICIERDLISKADIDRGFAAAAAVVAPMFDRAEKAQELLDGTWANPLQRKNAANSVQELNQLVNQVISGIPDLYEAEEA